MSVNIGRSWQILQSLGRKIKGKQCAMEYISGDTNIVTLIWRKHKDTKDAVIIYLFSRGKPLILSIVAKIGKK